MAKHSLVIVESPAKAKTIGKYLGKEFEVKACMGHLRDLPKSTLGVDLEHDFEPVYKPIKGKEDIIADLKKSAKSAEMVYLATDPDREGEAISWHLKELLDIPDDKTYRVTFNEITKKVVNESIAAPRAIDQNLVMMEKMKLIASRHDLVCLLHEKPFEGINGSGKHNNWSLGTESENLLDPGDTPLDNLQFIVFLTAVIEAVDNYQELLRASVASAGNDHRLGANEAPPAIMSIFLGDQLTEVVEKIIDGKASVHATRGVLDLGADTLPKLMQDNTDRNRTSPFAFTGNKFEFRACGSEQNVSDSNLVLDAAVAKSLKSFADALEGTPEDKFQDAALEYCKKVLTDHQRILFSGDGYSDEWPVEAEKRGLANNKTTADALPAFVSDKAIALFEETGVLTKAEAQCRYDCKLEKYNKLMNIEATTMVREARRTYRPVITAYATKVAKGLETIRAAGAEAAMQCEQNTLNKLCNGITTINDSIKALDAVHQKAEGLDGQEQANVYAHEVVPAMDALRAAVDAMEEIVAADYWPVPTYDDILFYV